MGLPRRWGDNIKEGTLHKRLRNAGVLYVDTTCLPSSDKLISPSPNQFGVSERTAPAKGPYLTHLGMLLLAQSSAHYCTLPGEIVGMLGYDEVDTGSHLTFTRP